MSILTTSLSFFFNDTATTEIYTLSLHDALPIFEKVHQFGGRVVACSDSEGIVHDPAGIDLELLKDVKLERRRSEEHTSELQSRQYLVCRLLLEKTSTTSSPRWLDATHSTRLLLQ